MKQESSFARWAVLQVRTTLAIAVTAACVSVGAQTITSVQTAAQPLTLSARGSFYVGGRSVEQSHLEMGNRGPATDTLTVDQMYVEYMSPAGEKRLPVVMIHGAGLSGKSYDTTPDGRMGWYEYFVRNAHPTYVVDQVGRARSGFNQASLNRAAFGESPRQDFPMPWRFGNSNGVWTNFRFGPKFGEPFADTQFPIHAIGELAKQAIPDLTAAVPVPNPTLQALAQLATDLHGAVLLGHSQSGHFPMEAALLRPKDVRAIVSVEPGRCRSAEYTDQQIAVLAQVPTLIIFGDHLPAPTGFTQITWEDRFKDCSVYVERIKKANGRMEMLHTPALGVKGNSHMLMHDRNSIQIADAILKWVNTNTTQK